MDKVEKKQVIGLLLTLVIAITSIYLYRHAMLKNTEETFAVFVEYNVGGGKAHRFFAFKTNKGEFFKSSVAYSESLEIGDTVWIEYSISNPNVIRVIGDYPKMAREE